MAEIQIGVVEERLDELELALAEARPMPLSASVLVSRDELSAMVSEIRDLLPDELRRSRWVLRERESVLGEAREEAERIIAGARQHAGQLVSDTEVVQSAEREAARIVHEAQEQARVMRLEAEDYIDAKLARFELVLQKTLRTVGEGRERLRGEPQPEDTDDPGAHTPLFDHERG